MKSCILRWLFVVGAILAQPVVGHAQEAAVSGTLTDTTGGVLPGVTATATHDAPGNTFVGVTDEREGKTTGYSVPQALVDSVRTGVAAWHRVQAIARALAERNRARLVTRAAHRRSR